MVIHPDLTSQFSHDEFLLRRLLAQDTNFAEICDSFCAAVEAVRHWGALGEIGRARTEEYAELAAELRLEIESKLKSAVVPTAFNDAGSGGSMTLGKNQGNGSEKDETV